MNNSPFKVIWVKAAIAFQIPFFTAIGSTLTPYVFGGAVAPQSHFLRLILVIVVLAAALVAGYSGLNSFLSTSFSEHKAKQEAGLDETQPAPITAAQVAASPTSVTVPVVKPAPEKP